MPRVIKDHAVGGLNENVTIEALDEPGLGGANHSYLLTIPPPKYLPNPIGGGERRPVSWNIQFQNGPIGETGDINGIGNEALLAVLIDRMRGFQSGQFACRENAIALTYLEDAMHWLQHRTRQRLTRGVEGTLVK